jgi:hypothetical protein
MVRLERTHCTHSRGTRLQYKYAPRRFPYKNRSAPRPNKHQARKHRPHRYSLRRKHHSGKRLNKVGQCRHRPHKPHRRRKHHQDKRRYKAASHSCRPDRAFQPGKGHQEKHHCKHILGSYPRYTEVHRRNNLEVHHHCMVPAHKRRHRMSNWDHSFLEDNWNYKAVWSIHRQHKQARWDKHHPGTQPSNWVQSIHPHHSLGNR